MDERMDSLLYRMRFVAGGVLILASLLFLVLLLSAISSSNASAGSYDMGGSDSPNAVTRSLSMMVDNLDRTTAATQRAITNGSRRFVASGASVGSHSVQFVVGGLKGSATLLGHGIRNTGLFTARAVGGSAAFVGQGVGTAGLFAVRTTVGSTLFVLRFPGNILGFISNTPVVRAAIRPADSVAVPVIDPMAVTLAAAPTALPAAQTVSQPQPAPAPLAVDMAPAWPIHGEITTEFGVYHEPWQLWHTGIDISDGEPAGVTPVHPYKPGRVVQTIRSSTGLGNHVVVDHGNGLTSVYGHMYAISVQVGQAVDKGTALGLEGSTGASTGPHVHFEIRVNDQPVNPHLYVTGQP